MWGLVIYFILFYFNFFDKTFVLSKCYLKNAISTYTQKNKLCKVMAWQQGITPNKSRVEMKSFVSRLLIITSVVCVSVNSCIYDV